MYERAIIVICVILTINCSILPHVNHNVDQNISSCFGKIRTLASMNTSFRTSLDTVIKYSRIDLIIKLLLSKVDEICTNKEKESVLDYFDNHFDAIQITENVMKNLTYEEKDHLNIWNNLKDTQSEANLYLRKFQQLPMRKQSILKHSLNDVLNTFVGSSLPPEITQIIGTFNKSEIKEIETLSRDQKLHEMGHIIATKINKTDISPMEKDGIYKYLYHLFAECN